MKTLTKLRWTDNGFVAYTAAVLGILAPTLLLIPVRGQINTTTIALAFLLIVLVVATLFGSRPALLTSVMGAFSFNFFFLPPFYTLTITEPQNWIALVVFLIVAATVGQLSANARHRAEIAEDLYEKLQAAFEQASEAEALKKSEKLKSSLLDAVTHDLRTPLTSIKAATTMLIEEQSKDALHRTLDPSRSADLLDVINEETDRLNSFIESMVGLARIEAGDISLRRSAVTVDQIVSNAVHRASGIARDNRIVVNSTPGLPRLEVDPRSIAEVLYNLIDNAVKYSPAGSVIEIGTSLAGDNMRFTVQDEGPGIPASERKLVFQKFHRGDRSSKGFGMGLAIASGIIEAHGGSIWIEDSIKGGRLVFELPIKT